MPKGGGEPLDTRALAKENDPRHLISAGAPKLAKKYRFVSISAAPCCPFHPKRAPNRGASCRENDSWKHYTHVNRRFSNLGPLAEVSLAGRAIQNGSF